MGDEDQGVEGQGSRNKNTPMKLNEHLYNQTVDILEIVAILIGITCDAVNVRSNRHVKKILRIFTKMHRRMHINQKRIRKHISLVKWSNNNYPKADNKQLNIPTLIEEKDDRDPDERIKEITKVVNDGDKESDIEAGKSVTDDGQEGEGKMNILRELGV